LCCGGERSGESEMRAAEGGSCRLREEGDILLSIRTSGGVPLEYLDEVSYSELRNEILTDRPALTAVHLDED